MPQPKTLTLTDSSDDLDIVIFNRPIAEQLPLAFTTSSMTLNLATVTLQMTVSPGADRAPSLIYGNSAFTNRSPTAASVAITKGDTDTLTPRQYYIEVRELDTGNETVLGAYLWNALSSPGYVPVIPPTPPVFISWSQVSNTPTTLAGYGITDGVTHSSLAEVAFSGSYGDLSGKPTLGTAAAHAATDFDAAGTAGSVAASLSSYLTTSAAAGTYAPKNNAVLTGTFSAAGGGVTWDAAGNMLAASINLSGVLQVNATTGIVTLGEGPGLGGPGRFAMDLSTGDVSIDQSLSVGGTLTLSTFTLTAAKSGTIAMLSDITTLWDDRGNYDASVNTFPASGGSGSAGAVLKGDIWTVSVAGTLGGTAVALGDTVRALVDTPGQTAGNWALAEHDLGYTPANNVLGNLGSIPSPSDNAAKPLLFLGAGGVVGQGFLTWNPATFVFTTYILNCDHFVQAAGNWQINAAGQVAGGTSLSFVWFNGGVAISGSADLGMVRNAPGFLEINNGSGGGKAGFKLNGYTTTEKNAISSPAEGMLIYDLTLHALCVYNGSAWKTVTAT